jgi:ammonia channel protein AmtB
MMSWLLLDHIRGLKFRATGVCVGAVVGLVAITPAAGECGCVEGVVMLCSALVRPRGRHHEQGL